MLLLTKKRVTKSYILAANASSRIDINS